MTEPVTLLAQQQPVDNFPRNQRRQAPRFGWGVYEPDESRTTASNRLASNGLTLMAFTVAWLRGETPDAHPSIAFLIRAWTMPTVLDWVIMSGLGLVWAGAMYFIACAYSAAEASVVAPFEYVSLPINIMWGFLLWPEVPTWLTVTGAALTVFSGLYVLYRERRERVIIEQMAGGKSAPV